MHLIQVPEIQQKDGETFMIINNKLYLMFFCLFAFAASCKNTQDVDLKNDQVLNENNIVDQIRPLRNEGPKPCCEIDIKTRENAKDAGKKVYYSEAKKAICSCRNEFQSAKLGGGIILDIESSKITINSSLFKKEEKQQIENCVLKKIEPLRSIDKDIKSIKVVFRSKNICVEDFAAINFLNE